MAKSLFKPSCNDVSVEDLQQEGLRDALVSPETIPLTKSKGKVFVQGDFANEATYRMFQKYGYEGVKTIEESDIVVWTGGEDINPMIYGERPAGAHYWNNRRDTDDLRAVKKAEGKFLVGVCRGAQLLNCVPNGGTLWQDVDQHAGNNHPVYDTVTGETVVVNSIHHQQLRLTDKAVLVAYTNLSRVKYSDAGTWHCDEPGDEKDVEVAWYPETRSLLAQFHPEFNQDGPTGKYFFRLMDRYWLEA